MSKLHNYILPGILLGSMLTTHLYLPLVGQAAPPAEPAATISVAQWSRLELAFTSATNYSNGYVKDIDLSVTFTSPAGVQKTIKGFWDGGTQFKVRFAPSTQGTWTYRTASTNDSSLVGHSGSFSVSAPLASNHGFLRINAANPYDFIWDATQNGAPLSYFMVGQTYYEIVRNAAGNGNWRAAVDNSAAYGIDRIRLLLYPWPGATADNPYPDTQPFTGPSKNPNHDQLNLTHWRLLDTIVAYLESKQMTADIILFADDDRIFGSKTQNDRYVRYAMARLAAYHNVIWTVTNEWNYADPDKDGVDGTANDKALFVGWAGLIGSTDPYAWNGKNRRPVTIHQQTRSDFQFFGSISVTPATLQYGLRSGLKTGDAWGSAAIHGNWGHSVPVVLDEFVYLGEVNGSLVINRTAVRQTLWAAVVSGGYATIGDATPVNSGKPFLTGDWRYDSTYLDVKRFKDFWTTRGINYAAMSPQNQTIASGTRVYVYGTAGRDYVVDAAQGGSFSLNLPPATYAITRFNPNADCTSSCDISHGTKTGSTLQFSSTDFPSGTDWIVVLHNTSS